MYRKIVLLSTALVLMSLSGCDILKPQRTFRMALSKQSSYYHTVAEHLQSLLQSKGYALKIIEAENAFQACEMVADGKADLSLLNNFSFPVAESLKEKGGALRTVLPISLRVFHLFSRQPVSDTATVRYLFTGKRVGIELLGGETETNLARRLKQAGIHNTTFVLQEDQPDLIAMWGGLYSEEGRQLLDQGWHPVSLDANWIEFNTKFDPAIQPIYLPAIPGDPRSKAIQTYSSQVLLVGSNSMGENAVYQLSQLLLQHRIELLNKDHMYNALEESFNASFVLFPLHEGTFAYLKRDEPALLERYADTIALFLSLGAILYGVLQTVNNRIRKRQKDRIDIYFMEFLEIRSSAGKSLADQQSELESLHRKALEQMTKEKLDKGDFHIFSRLVQQEVALMRALRS